MKILVLSYPYHGAYSLCEEISKSLGYTFVNDPMDLNYHGASGRYDVEYTHPRPYVFPNDVPNNSLTLHFVKWHRLPGNRTETQFLQDWDLFNKVISIRSNNLETNWKTYCAAKAAVLEDNIEWERYAQMNSFYGDYEDSHYDQACVDKITAADSFLASYASENGITETIIQDIQKQSAAENNKNPEVLNNEFARWNIGLPWIGFRNGAWENQEIYETLMGWGNRY